MWMIEIGILLSSDKPDANEKWHELLLCAYEELQRLDVADPDYVASVADGLIKYSMVVEMDDREAACRHAAGCVRSALHHAGTSTPVWDVDRAIDNASIASRRLGVLV